VQLRRHGLRVHGSKKAMIKRLDKAASFRSRSRRLSETECNSLKVHELKRLLMQRDLMVSGPKTYLIARLMDFQNLTSPGRIQRPTMFHTTKSRALRGKKVKRRHAKECKRVRDENDPDPENPTSFRFQALPPELRNVIYELVASSKAPSGTIDEPSLFNTCKQIRAETVGLFLHHHKFHFTIRSPPKTHLDDLLTWLQRLGKSGRSSLRYLTFYFDAAESHLIGVNSFRKYVKRIHKQLSDTATVVYVTTYFPTKNEWLWNQGCDFLSAHRSSQGMLPTFTYDEKEYPLNYNVRPTFHQGWSGGTASLTFRPGMSWFGRQEKPKPKPKP